MAAADQSYPKQGCGKSYCRKTTLTKHTRRNHAAVIKSSHGRDQGTIGPVTIGSNSGPLPSFNFRAGMARSHSDMPSFIGSSFGNSGFGAPAEQQAGLLYYNTYSETNSNSIDGTQESAPTSRRSSADYHTSSSTMTQPQSPSVKSPPTAVYLHQSFAQPSYYYPTSASVLPPPPPAPSGDLYSPKGNSQDEASGRHHHQPDHDYQHQHMQHHTPQHHAPQRGYQIMPSIDGQSSFASSELPSMDAPATPLQHSSFPKSENPLPATTTSACFSFYEPSTPMPLSLQSPYNAHQQHHGHFSAPAHPQQQCQQQQPTVSQVRLPPLTPVQHFHHNQQQQQQTRYMSEHGAMRAQQLYAEGVTAKVEETHQ